RGGAGTAPCGTSIHEYPSVDCQTSISPNNPPSLIPPANHREPAYSATPWPYRGSKWGAKLRSNQLNPSMENHTSSENSGSEPRKREVAPPINHSASSTTVTECPPRGDHPGLMPVSVHDAPSTEYQTSSN